MILQQKHYARLVALKSIQYFLFVRKPAVLDNHLRTARSFMSDFLLNVRIVFQNIFTGITFHVFPASWYAIRLIPLVLVETYDEQRWLERSQYLASRHDWVVLLCGAAARVPTPCNFGFELTDCRFISGPSFTPIVPTGSSGLLWKPHGIDSPHAFRNQCA